MKKCIILFLLLNIYIASAQNYPLSNVVPKPKLAYLKSDNSVFGINYNTCIILNRNNPQFKAAYFLNKKLREFFAIDTCRIFLDMPPDNYSNLIHLGVCDGKINHLLSNLEDHSYYVDANNPGEQGYIIDVSNNQVLINGSDEEGLINAIRTLSQTLLPGDVTTFLPTYRCIDVPDFPIRWVYFPTNFLVGSNTIDAKNKWKLWSDWKINAINIADAKFEFISTQPKRYFDSLTSANIFAKKEMIELVPSTMSWGYSNGMMFFNPNFASGLPVQIQKIVIEADTGRIIPTQITNLPNGDFEKYNGNNFSGFLFIDSPGTQSFVDNNIYKSGNTSIRFENFNGANARVCYRTKVSPFKQYHISAWVKTENAQPSGDIRITVLNNKKQTLNFSNLNVPSTTNGWKKIDITVNSLLGDTMTVYWGMWGAESGKIWWDKLEVEEVAFVNLLRREGTPLNISHQFLDVMLREGIDFDTLIDKKLGTAAGWLGEFDTYHIPPTFRIKKDGMLNNGDTIFASYYHAITIYDGQVMVTMSDEELYKQVEKQFRLLDSTLKAKTYFLTHDEIRVMNWDYGDQSRGMEPKEILADNVKRSIEIVHKYNKEAKLWNWSDMFDNFHNAKNNYYLVNGDLTNVIDLIPPEMGIVNWNFGNSEKSLKFFEEKGFKQISAPFYDTDANNIRIWKEKTANTNLFKGMIYTTWSRNYNYVKHFAEYSWNHAPYLYHKPLWGIIPKGKQKFEVKIIGDLMDKDWKLKQANLYYRTDKNAEFTSLPLNLEGDSSSIEIDLSQDNSFLEYYISALDNRGNFKRNPLENDKFYSLGTPSNINYENHNPIFELSPNPANTFIEINLKEINKPVEITLYNTLGEIIYIYNSLDFFNTKIKIDITSLENGTYFIKIGTDTKKFVKI